MKGVFSSKLHTYEIELFFHAFIHTLAMLTKA